MRLMSSQMGRRRGRTLALDPPAQQPLEPRCTVLLRYSHDGSSCRLVQSASSDEELQLKFVQTTSTSTCKPPPLQPSPQFSPTRSLLLPRTSLVSNLPLNHGFRTTIRTVAVAASLAARVHTHQPIRFPTYPRCCGQEVTGGH